MKKRILALILVLALFIAVFSVSALAAFDQKGTAEAKEARSPIRAHYWIDEEKQVGCYLVNPFYPSNLYSSPFAHLEEFYYYNYDPATEGMYFYGRGLINTSFPHVVVFGWASPNVPNER